MKPILLSILALLLVAAAFIAFSGWRWSRAIDAESRDLAAAAKPGGTIVTDAAVEALPAPIRRFLRKAGVVGEPIPTVVRLKQKGRMRGSPAAAWMPFEADQVYSIDPPRFVWRANFPSRSLPLVFGRDFYRDGDSGITMKALGVWPVADLRGGELGEAGLMRFLNEMMWFPAAYLGANVSWKALDDRSAEVSISDHGLTATAVVLFDENDDLVNFRALRYNTDTLSLEAWETPISRHGPLAGLSALPLQGQAVWKLPDGDFAYIELDIAELSYE